MQISNMATTVAPYFCASRALSPRWSSWPWVSTMKSTWPSRSSKPCGNFGLPVQNGSIRMLLPPVAR